MSFRCSRCGSTSHTAYDCSKPQTYMPTAADLAADAAEQVAVQEPPKPVAVAVAEPVFEAGVRFVGCPKICTKTNLPAHESEAAAEKFHKLNAPSCTVLKVGLCKACGKWHLKSLAPAPQDSKQRSGPLPPGWVPFRRKMRASSFTDTAQEQLPQHEVAVDPGEPKKVEFKPKKKVASKPLGGLFEATR